MTGRKQLQKYRARLQYVETHAIMCEVMAANPEGAEALLRKCASEQNGHYLAEFMTEDLDSAIDNFEIGRKVEEVQQGRVPSLGRSKRSKAALVPRNYRAVDGGSEARLAERLPERWCRMTVAELREALANVPGDLQMRFNIDQYGTYTYEPKYVHEYEYEGECRHDAGGELLRQRRRR
jgi:hypothetical protein